MNEDLGIFERELKELFVDPPLPESLEAGRVAEALKKPQPEIKLAPAPWKRALRIAACVALVAGAATISIIALRQRAGGALMGGNGADETFFTQSTAAGSEAGAGGEAEGGVIVAPEDEKLDALQTPDDASWALIVASEDSGVPMPNGLDEAVSAAIIASNASADDGGESLRVEAHYVLGSEDSESSIIVYAETAYREYKLGEDGAPVMTAGVSVPVAITFDKTEDAYSLAEYRVPLDGADYESSIREIFPERLVKPALALAHAPTLGDECDARANAHFMES